MRNKIFTYLLIFVLFVNAHKVLAQQRRYTCKYITQQINIDANNDAAWNTAQWIPDFVDILGQQKKTIPSTRVKMLWDDTYIYFFVVLEEKHIWATITEPNIALFTENAFEIFIDPEGDGKNYFEIQINALGNCWDLQLSAPYRSGGKANPKWDAKGMKLAVNNRGTINNPKDEDLAWVIEMALPYSALQISTPKQGQNWKVNFARVQWDIAPNETGYTKKKLPNTNANKPAEYYLWSPHRVRDMHQPRKFGTVMFRQ